MQPNTCDNPISINLCSRFYKENVNSVDKISSVAMSKQQQYLPDHYLKVRRIVTRSSAPANL